MQAAVGLLTLSLMALIMASKQLGEWERCTPGRDGEQS